MGVQKKQPDEIIEPVEEKVQVEAPEPSLPEPVPEPVPEEPKKVGRPKKEKKPRTPAQLANDEKQRQRFKKEHEARKKKAAESKPEETKTEPDPPVPEPEQLEESEPEVDEETVYIKRKPRRKTKRTYVIEPSSSDESSEDERPRRGYQRRVPQPRFSQETEPFTLTFK
jgi:hypothetical protein